MRYQSSIFRRIYCKPYNHHQRQQQTRGEYHHSAKTQQYEKVSIFAQVVVVEIKALTQEQSQEQTLPRERLTVYQV